MKALSKVSPAITSRLCAHDGNQGQRLGVCQGDTDTSEQIWHRQAEQRIALQGASAYWNQRTVPTWQH